MLSDRSKIQYARSVLRRQYTGATTSSGNLVAGKFYRITEFKSGDDFSNVGIPSMQLFSKGRTGIIFQASGAAAGQAVAPTLWTKGSRLTELKVAELRAYSLEVFTEASDQIAITAGSFEGGQGSGQIVFEKSILGLAIESLLAEFDPDYFSSPPIPRRASGISVRL